MPKLSFEEIWWRKIKLFGSREGLLPATVKVIPHRGTGRRGGGKEGLAGVGLAQLASLWM